MLEFFPYFLLSVLSGVLLILPDKQYWKLSWLVCIFQFMVLNLLSLREETLWDQLQVLKILNVGFNFTGLFLTWKFNPFPYLDRFLPQAKVPAIRHSLMSPMTFPDFTDLTGQTMDLSETGCKTSFDVGDVITFELNQIVWASLPLISDEYIQVRIVAMEKPFVRFEYVKPSAAFIEKLHAFVAESQEQIQKLPEVTVRESTASEIPEN